MCFKLYSNWCILSWTQQYLSLRFYVQFMIILHYLTDKVKSGQISNIFTPECFIEGLKRVPFCHGPIKIAEKSYKNIELELCSNISQL